MFIQFEFFMENGNDDLGSVRDMHHASSAFIWLMRDFRSSTKTNKNSEQIERNTIDNNKDIEISIARITIEHFVRVEMHVADKSPPLH